MASDLGDFAPLRQIRTDATTDVEPMRGTGNNRIFEIAIGFPVPDT
jgi:hypothetical protein